MAWNGSGSAATSAATNKKIAKPRKASSGASMSGAFKGTLALIIVLAVGAGAYWYVSQPSVKSMKPIENETENNEIAEVASESQEIVEKQLDQEQDIIDVSKMSKAWQKYYDGRDTNAWKVVYNPLTKKEYLSRIVKPGLKNARPPLYKENALNVLDAVAFRPITSIMPNVNINERFMKSLQAGMIEKISISEDDTEDEKARKQGMIELISELKVRVKSGEDIQELIKESIEERNRIATLKQMMQRERRDMERNGASESEINEFVKACNSKLEENGATPILTKGILQERNLLK